MLDNGNTFFLNYHSNRVLEPTYIVSLRCDEEGGAHFIFIILPSFPIAMAFENRQGNGNIQNLSNFYEVSPPFMSPT
ncbi:hypothetical protein JTB14_000954 [Gonioctena quinquepunctata]|nr:hypothetical protein JTB14_000954 [Gonioctena quinquepunctata]